MKGKKSYFNLSKHNRHVFNEFLSGDKNKPYPCCFQRYRFKLDTIPGIGECLWAVGIRKDERYDPFKQLSESKIRDIPTPYNEFASLMETPESLLEYANRCGVPGTRSRSWSDTLKTTLVQTSPPRTEIDELSDTLGSPSSFSEFQNLLKKDRTDVLYPLNWFREDIRHMRKILDMKGASDVLNTEDGQNRAQSLCLFVTRELENVRVSLSLTEEGLQKTYRVKTIIEALHLTLLEDLALDTRRCADPKCGRYFNVNHKGKIFCTSVCAHRFSRRETYRRNKST